LATSLRASPTLLNKDRRCGRVKSTRLDHCAGKGDAFFIMADSEPGFDQVLAQLRGVVEKLEGGNLTLEQSLAAFEEGVRLSRKGAEILDQAERRVELLSRGEDGDAVMPFTVGPGEGEGGS